MSVQSASHKFFSYFHKSHSHGENQIADASKSSDITGPRSSDRNEEAKESHRDFGPSSILDKEGGHFRARESRRDFSSFHRAYSRASEEARFNNKTAEARGTTNTAGPENQERTERHRGMHESFGGLNFRAIFSFLQHLSSISTSISETTGEQSTSLASVENASDASADKRQVAPETVAIVPEKEVAAQKTVELAPISVAPQIELVSPPSTIVPTPEVSQVPIAVVQPTLGSVTPVNPPVVASEVQQIEETPVKSVANVVAPVIVPAVVPVTPAAEVGKVFEVSSAAGLQELLSQNVSGTTIKLLPGDYIGVNFKNFNPAEEVKIISADANNPTRLARINIENSSNVSFDNIEFRADSNSEAYWDRYVVRVAGSTDVDFSASVFSGGEGMQNSDLIGLFVDNSNKVDVTGSEFTNTARGAIFSNSNELNVEGNNIHNIQSDGFNFVGVTDVLIDKNTFGDFYPKEGDHADYIQFWLSGAKQGSENVTISNNFMAQSGGGRVQGIFITNTDEFTNTNFVIENNAVYQSGYHGISVSGVEGLIIQDNSVISSDDGRDTWIKVGNAENAQILNNITNNILLDESAEIVSEGNIIAKPDGVRGVSYGDLFQGALIPETSDPNSFLRLAGINVGADMLSLLID